MKSELEEIRPKFENISGELSQEKQLHNDNVTKLKNEIESLNQQLTVLKQQSVLFIHTINEILFRYVLCVE